MNELRDNVEWDTADESDSTDESLPYDEDISEELVITSDDDTSTDSARSTIYETPSKKAKKNLVNSNGIEDDVSTNGGTRSRKKSNKIPKNAYKELVIISDDDTSTDSARSTTYETPSKKAKKNLVNSNGIEDDVSTDGGTRSRKKSNKIPKNANKVSDEIVGDHWSQDEKALLLASIKQYGMLNLTRLASIIGTKNIRQIKDFIARVSRSIFIENKKNAIKRATRRLATYKIANYGRRLLRLKSGLAYAKKQKLKQFIAQEMGESPIEWWLHYMENTLSEMTKQSKVGEASNPRRVSEMIPRACLLISEYENHPHPSTCGGVDYKEAYDCLYHVMSGVAPKALSPPTALFIQRSIDRLRNSILDGMYSPEYCKSFGEQVSHIQAASTETRLPPKRTYGAPSKKSGPVMAPGVGLPNPSQSLEGLMDTPGFNVMKLPETLTWRKGFAPIIDLPVVKGRSVIRKDIPFGLFSDTDIYEGFGPSKTTT